MIGAFELDPPLAVDDRRRARLALGEVAAQTARATRRPPSLGLSTHPACARRATS